MSIDRIPIGDAVLDEAFTPTSLCSRRSRVPPLISSIANTACARHNPAMVLFLSGLALGVCLLLLIDVFLRRSTSIEMRSVSRIFLGGIVVLALVVYLLFRLLFRPPWTWEVALYLVGLIVSVTLILLGLFGIYSSGIKRRRKTNG